MRIEAIFEAAQKVPWKALRSLVGNCAHIPESLKGIFSDNDEIRNESYWNLDNKIIIQGGLSEGAFYVVPFLVALLNSDSVLIRNRIYDLLFEIGNGSAETTDIVSFTNEYSPFPYCVPNNSGITCPLQIACRNAVLYGIQTYLAEVTNKSSNYRNKSLELIGNFYEHEYYITSTLVEIAKNEENDFKSKIESLLYAIGR